jgi:hypothetical protein
VIEAACWMSYLTDLESFDARIALRFTLSR